MNALTRFDTTALNQLNRALIGFDRIFHDVENRYANSTTNYPPFNILQHGDTLFEIEIAVAGFDKDDITIELDQNQLRIKGQRIKVEDDTKYVHRGLAARDFERVFTIADHIEIGEAELTNGILHVTLTRRIPEELKPRLIAIK